MCVVVLSPACRHRSGFEAIMRNRNRLAARQASDWVGRGERRLPFKLVLACCVEYSRPHSYEAKVSHTCSVAVRSISHTLSNASIVQIQDVRSTHTRRLMYSREGPRSQMFRSTCVMTHFWRTPRCKDASLRLGGRLCRLFRGITEQAKGRECAAVYSGSMWCVRATATGAGCRMLRS